MEAPAAGRGAAWAFFIAGALALAGGILPTLLAGTSGRISNVIVPFWLGALAFAASGAFRHLGKTLVTVGYLAGGLAVVFGMLGMFAVLVQLTVLTTCPPGTAACGLGFTRPLTPAETTGIGYAMGMGTVALVAGFVGLRAVYRQHGHSAESFSVTVRGVAPSGPTQEDALARAEPEPDTGVTGQAGSEEGA